MATAFDRYAVLITNLLDEYRMSLVTGMLPVLAANGISLLVHAEDPFQLKLSPTLATMLHHAPPCGIIATGGAIATYEGELFNLLSDLLIPLVSVAMEEIGTVNVRCDNTSATKDLLAHLLDERGIRRPALVRGTPGQKDSIEREALIKQELLARGLAFDEGLGIDGDFGVDVAYSSMRVLLRTRRDMDAVIALNDLSAMGAWRALTEVGLRVPEDVLLSGFDNEQIAFMNWPGLTTVDHDLTGQGAAAAKALVCLTRGEATSFEVVLPGQLVIRGSTGESGHSPQEERDNAVKMARAARTQLAEQDALLAFNQAMMRCATITDMVDALSSSHLERLGITRCVLAVYEPDDASRARLLLDYWEGTRHPIPIEAIPIHELLRHELGGEVLVFQPLSIADRSLGYVLFEHAATLGTLPEILRIDLSRTLGAMLSSQDLKDYAQTLEQQVELRTKELKQEIGTRRRAEAELHRLNAGLQRSLMIDGLTGIANRNAFERHFELYGPAGPGGDELALLFVDVDLFKAYNDLYGHVMGDEALRQVASCLTRAVRYPQDLACRWGGEEFAVLLPGSGAEGAMIVAERFMALLEFAQIPHAGSTIADHLSASVGIALTVSHPGLNSTDLIEAADQALYAAKTSGRNRIHQAESLAAPTP